jgi:hypothetical protein
MELYSGPKMMDDEYLKSNIARSIDRDSTVLGSMLFGFQSRTKKLITVAFPSQLLLFSILLLFAEN